MQKSKKKTSRWLIFFRKTHPRCNAGETLPQTTLNMLPVYCADENIKNPRVVSSGTVLKLVQIMFPTYRLQRYAAPSGAKLNVLSVYCKQHKKAQREVRG